MRRYDYNFSCFKIFREKLYKANKTMYPFMLKYRKKVYYVAAYTILHEERDICPEYSLLRLNFMKKENLDNTYDLFINIKGILNFASKELRRFFDIPYDENGYGFINYFCENLIKYCPMEVKEIKEKQLKTVERHSLCRKIGYDPEHCYRQSLMLLPNNKKRDPKRFQLAQIIFPHATKQYYNAEHVTYCFTDNPDEEVSEEVAIERFIEKHGTVLL